MSKQFVLQTEEVISLRIEKELSFKLDKIIENIGELAKKFNIEQEKERSPFKNVLSMSTEINSSLGVITNFIRYQAGRKESSRVWKISKDNKTFATAVVEQIDSLSRDAEEIIEWVKKSFEKDEVNKDEEISIKVSEYFNDPSKQERITKELYLKLAQLYLGYLAREHTARIGEARVRQNNNLKTGGN